MKTIITGGAGFIGTNLVLRLLKEGRDITVIDNVERGHKENLEGLDVETIYADLRDYSQAAKAIQNADVVYHLAARVGSVNYLHGTNSAELETLQDNLLIDTNVFRACRESGVKKIVYASSVSVYPIEKQQVVGARFREEDIYPISPEGGYGWAKFMGEVQLGMTENCKSAIARIFNAYGEYNDYGEYAQVVPSLIKKALFYPKQPYVVWGDGNQTRCLLYIDDCIDALLKLEGAASYPPPRVNIGSEEETPIRELVRTIIKISGKEIEPEFDPSMPVGPRSRVPDTRKARELLGWEPRTPLEMGLRRTYAFIEESVQGIRKRTATSGTSTV